MKRIVSFIVVLAVAMCGMTQVMAQKSITKEAKKVEREIKKQEPSGTRCRRRPRRV